MAAWRTTAASGRKAPSLTGPKPLLRGRNGAVSPRCNPIATRGATELSTLSELASERQKLGAATSTDVALRRPRTTRSRMAILTELEMPKSSAHSQMRRRPVVSAAVTSTLSVRSAHTGNLDLISAAQVVAVLRRTGCERKGRVGLIAPEAPRSFGRRPRLRVAGACALGGLEQ